MDLSRYLSMDVNMLLSIVNMKLRDESGDLIDLCRRYELDQTQLELRLRQYGWFYHTNHQQFSQIVK